MTEQMKKKIEQFCIANDLLHKKDGIVVGVSGGADSVFLIYFLKEIMERWELRLHVVHINHGIRGKEALHDEQYTKELSKRFSIPCTIFRENIPKRATEWKMTEEEGKQELLWYERRFCDNIERYGKFFEDEATKKEVSQLKAERAEKNLNAIRAMGIEV